MKRIEALGILALAWSGAAAGAEVWTRRAQGGVALRARELVALRDGSPRRFCPGARNGARVVVSNDGDAPGRTIPVQLQLVLPGTPPGTLLAEGSVIFDAGARLATFTFLNVEIPARLRGRGARLVARVNADRTVPERDLADNTVALDVDASTDWGCAG
jgi:hypothetical protein